MTHQFTPNLKMTSTKMVATGLKMRTRLRILGQGLFVLVLAFAFAPQSFGADTILYATDLGPPQPRIWAVNITTGINTLVTNIPPGHGRADSLIFDASGNILYGLLDNGELGSFNPTTHTNTILVTGLGSPADLTLEPSKTSVLISDYSHGKILRYVLGAPSFTVLANFNPTFNRVDGLTYDNSPTPKLFAVLGQNTVAQISPIDGHIINQLTGLTGTLDGITFDPVTGDLWVSRNVSGGLWRIPTNLSGSTLWATTIPHPDGLESDGVGNIFAASSGTNVYQYNIAGNVVTQKNAVPHLDDVAPLVGLGGPTPGYLEICKESNPDHPVTGTFTFTATNFGFNSGPIQVPVGQCSGPIQVPSGAVTVTETPVLGDLVSNVTAYSYDSLGFYVDELNSWTLPDLHAIVNVVADDQDEETVATFTNYAAPPGQLKICKIAGMGVPLGTPFSFFASWGFWQFNFYTVLAGPADQGGYCTLAGTYVVNTPVLVSELLFVGSPYQVSNITVSPPDRGSSYTSNSVIVTIGDGFTEATFTNILLGRQKP